MEFIVILASFWEAFGRILGSKSRSKLGVVFGFVFVEVPRRDAAATRLRRDVGAPATQLPGPPTPPGRRPFRARSDPITTLASQTRDLTRLGPEAWRISSRE